MSLKHEITLDNIRALADIRTIVFAGVAENKHYKAVYEIAIAKNISPTAAIVDLLDNKEFADKCVEYANRPDIYEKCMKRVTGIWRGFEDIVTIPSREADFMVDLSRHGDETWDSRIFFFIEEGVELDIEGNVFAISRLLVDNVTDTLLYNSGEGWYEYKLDSVRIDSIASKVNIAFKNYIADKELLGDKDE